MSHEYAKPSEVEALKAAREKGRVLVERWMDVAAALLETPDKLTGKELNRAGELLISANNWLRDEIKRAESHQQALRYRSDAFKVLGGAHDR